MPRKAVDAEIPVEVSSSQSTSWPCARFRMSVHKGAGNMGLLRDAYVHHELARDGQGDAGTKILLDQCQRKIDSRGEAARGVESAITHEQLVGIHA